MSGTIAGGIEVALGTVAAPDIEIALAPASGTMSGTPVYPLAALPGQDWVQETVSGTSTWVRQISPLTQRNLSLESGFSLLLESGGRLLLEP
jgi:hypothetical protein